MNYKEVGNRIRANKDKIIAMYEADTSLIHIAVEYGVADCTIYRYLQKWGVPLKRGIYRRRKREVKKYKRKFSPEFLAHQAEITRLNKGKIKYIKFEGTTEDQKLVSNILCRPVIG